MTALPPPTTVTHIDTTGNVAQGELYRPWKPFKHPQFGDIEIGAGAWIGARAVVLPSEWYENAPMSVLEAYASGTPVKWVSVGPEREAIIRR